MNRLVKYMQKNSITTVISAVLIGIIIMVASTLAAKPIINLINNSFELNFYTQNAVMKLFMLLFSILLILFFNNGKLSGYGFRRAANIHYPKFTLKVVGISFASFVFGLIVFMVILNKLFPTGNSTGFPEQNSLIQMILTIWIWSSLCEEVMVRGLIQSFMHELKHIKVFKLSLPVIVSGLFFGSMHLSLFKAGMGMWFVLFIVFNTSVIGLMAAYYREKTESLIPAFWVHFIANAVGSLPLIIKMLITT